MFQVKKQNKYGNIEREYNGILYVSKKEAAYAQELDLRKKAEDIKDWKRQVKISLDVNGYHICNYYVDFEIEHNDESKELVEIKGFETEIFRLKRKLLEAVFLTEHLDYSYTVIK